MADEPQPRTNLLIGAASALGVRALGVLDKVGGAWFLLVEACGWIVRSVMNRRIRLGRAAIFTQMVRIGVQSVLIITLVSASVGFILGLQMAPPLDDLGSKELIPNIIGIAVIRELGPLMAAIVLTGFAGAAIAAEIGTMVVSEEIEALEAHALNPVRFLVVPRLIATVVSMTALAVIADTVAVGAGLLMGVTVLDLTYATYMTNTLQQVETVDFVTGLIKASVFGLLIGLIACHNGLKVRGGAAGVGNATTYTVVQSVLAIIIADLIFTAIFYATGLV
jgi:phospholipid/cholesterol/gamma-HCH transport system permease protein